MRRLRPGCYAPLAVMTCLAPPAAARPLDQARILETWWPLALSWLLMGLELPALSAVVARMPEPRLSLAAYGGVVFPVALIIESPIIMLLAASTALSRDRASYRKLRRFMHSAGACLTLVHVLIAFTPLYDLLVAHVLGTPEPIREPARLGLRIFTPWTWTIAYRRFNQGVLIRWGRSRAVGLGTLLRLLANVVVLALAYLAGVPGIVAATAAVTAGVCTEALYVGLRVRPVLRGSLAQAPPAGEPLTRGAFLRFYSPLALTSLLMLLMEPIGAAALGRMPRALDCLAVWPVLAGLVFLAKSLGIALNEVVVALRGEPEAPRALGRFTLGLAGLTVLCLGGIAATPLAGLWFGGVAGLPEPLVALASRALALAVPMPGLVAFLSLLQGTLVHTGRTRAIPEAVAIYLGSAAVVCVAGVYWQGLPGLYVTVAAMLCGYVAQAWWLRHRTRSGTLEPGRPEPAAAGR